MQLDKIIIALRQRNPWEAMDLGVKLMRVLWPVLLFPWLIMISTVLAFSIFAETQGYWNFAAFLMWWLKPLYDSLILYILSRGIFGEYPTAGDVYAEKSQWIKTGLLSTLFFWRFSLSRSFDMPVHLLEGLSGSARKERLQVLHRVSSSHSTGVTIIGLHFESLLTITFYAVVFFIAPDTIGGFFDQVIEQTDDQTAWFIIGSVIYAIVLFILEPFYVAAGFMLYLNRRTQLEAWDIELDFKKLVQRLNQPHEHQPHSQQAAEASPDNTNAGKPRHE